MFLLTGYEYFLGFLLIAAAVPVLALVTNLIVAPRGLQVPSRISLIAFGDNCGFNFLTPF